MFKNSKPRGFIALMSALIIATVLLLIATGGSLSGFYGRMDSLDFEAKERSAWLARACVEHTLQALAHDPSYTALATTSLTEADSCYTGLIKRDGTPPNELYSFKTRATVMSAYTIYTVSVRGSDLSVQSFTELPTF